MILLIAIGAFTLYCLSIKWYIGLVKFLSSNEYDSSLKHIKCSTAKTLIKICAFIPGLNTVILMLMLSFLSILTFIFGIVAMFNHLYEQIDDCFD